MTYTRLSSPLGYADSRLTAAQIDGAFAQTGTPPPGLGAAIHRWCRHWDVNADIAAGQCHHETGGWTSRIAREKLNPAGIGALNHDPFGTALTFTTVDEGVAAFIAHIVCYTHPQPSQDAIDRDPRYPELVKRNWVGIVRVLADYEQRWAWSPPAQYNAAPIEKRYGAMIAARTNMLLEKGAGVPPQPTTRRIALAAGHRNASGGDAHEAEQTARLTPAIAVALRNAGFDVRVVTPDEGRGMYPGGLADVAAVVVDWHRAGWQADFFLEVHTEGAGASVRGSFGIYPDWPAAQDFDADALDIGQDIARRLRDALGLPLRGDGAMSERNTGVGGQGHRLGVFRVTEPIKATCTRMIYEFGSHDNAADLAIVDNPDNLPVIGRCVAEALVAFYKLPQPSPVPTPVPAPLDFSKVKSQRDPWRNHAGGNPYTKNLWVPNPFVAHLNEPGRNWIDTGFFVSGAFQVGEQLVQFAERARLELNRDGSVTRGLVGLETGRRDHPDRLPT